MTPQRTRRAPLRKKRAPATSPAATARRPRTSARSTAPAAIDAVLKRQPWSALRTLLDQIGAGDPERTLAGLRSYARSVIEWNRGVSNIISRNDEPRFVERHLVESLAAARALRESGAGRWLDFGSGAGLPAIPLALAGVGSAWTLVESRRTKTLFLRKTLQSMSLVHFDVINDRLENVVERGSISGSIDGFTSRATLTLEPTLTLAAPLVRTGGFAFLWKGSGFDEEMKEDLAWASAWEHKRVIPVGSGPNIVAVFVRK